MNQGIARDRFFGIWKIRAAEVQDPFSRAKLLNDIETLNEVKVAVHRKILAVYRGSRTVAVPSKYGIPDKDPLVGIEVTGDDKCEKINDGPES